jgi:integrase/recombinase XerD
MAIEKMQTKKIDPNEKFPRFVSSCASDFPITDLSLVGEYLAGKLHDQARVAGDLRVVTALQKLLNDSGQIVEVNTQEAVTRFLTSKQGAVSEQTVKNYRSMLGKFAAQFPILPAAPEQIEDFLRGFKSKTSANTAYSTLSVFYKFCKSRLGVRNILQDDVKRPRIKSKERDSLSFEQITDLVKTIQTDFERGLVYLYAFQGLRLSEARSLKVQDIFNDRLRVKGKSGEQFAPLLPEVRVVLLRLCEGRQQNEAIFSLDHVNPISTTYAEDIIKRLFSRAGIIGIKAVPHTLRHTFGTLLRRNGCDYLAIQRLLRHEAPKSITDHYVHLTFDDLCQALVKFSPLTGIISRDNGIIAENVGIVR